MLLLLLLQQPGWKVTARRCYHVTQALLLAPAPSFWGGWQQRGAQGAARVLYHRVGISPPQRAAQGLGGRAGAPFSLLVGGGGGSREGSAQLSVPLRAHAGSVPRRRAWQRSRGALALAAAGRAETRRVSPEARSLLLRGGVRRPALGSGLRATPWCGLGVPWRAGRGAGSSGCSGAGRGGRAAVRGCRTRG